MEIIFLLTSVSPNETEFYSKATAFVTLNNLDIDKKSNPTFGVSYWNIKGGIIINKSLIDPYVKTN